MDSGDIEKDREYMGKNESRGEFRFRYVGYEMTDCGTCRCRCSKAGKTYV